MDSDATANVVLPLVWDGATLSIPRASSTEDGYLSHDDFILFSGGEAVPVTSFNTRTGEVILLEDDVLAALGYVPLNKHGDTMTGPLTLAGPPTLANHAATRNYVDTHAGGSSVGIGDYPVSAYGASGSKLKFTGSASAGSTTLTTTAASDFQVGHGIYIAAAGTGGKALVTKVTAISGTAITLQNPTVGAVTAVTGNVQHDDTVAIQAAIDACFAAGGGTVVFDDLYGFYRINKGFSDINSILKIPYTPWMSGSVAGPPAPIMRFKGAGLNVAGVYSPAPTIGPIIQTDLVGANSTTSMLSAATYVPGFAIVGNYMSCAIEGLTFRTYDNPNICGLDMGMMWNLYIKDVLVDTGMQGQENFSIGGTAPGGSQPTHGTFGIRLPRANACTVVDTNNVSVSNYGIGIIGSELWHCNNTWVQRCVVGVQTHETDCNYPITGNLLLIQCATMFEFLSRVPVDLHIECETRNGGWWTPLPGRFIYDPLNYAHGVIKYAVISSDGEGSIPMTTTGLMNLTLWSLSGFGVKIADDNVIARNIDVANVIVRGALDINDGAALQPLTVGANNSATASGFREVQVPNGAALPSVLSGLVSYWRMDEAGAADTRIDVLGNSHLTSLSGFGNNPVVAGRVGNAAHSTTNQFLYSIGNVSQHFSSSMSIAGWINITTLAGGNGQHCLLSKLSTTTDVEFLLFWRNDFARWEFTVTSDGSTMHSATVVATPALNTWYHVAAVYDASVNQIRLRINDGLVGADTQPFTGPLFSSSANMGCGLVYFGAAAYGDCAFDELGLWDRALTLAEITHLYNTGLGLTYPF